MKIDLREIRRNWIELAGACAQRQALLLFFKPLKTVSWSKSIVLQYQKILVKYHKIETVTY